MPNGVIYCLCDPASNEMRYIGWTHDPDKRLRRHAVNARAGRAYPLYEWMRSLDEPPTLRLLETDVPDRRIPARERAWIATLRAWGARLLNVEPGGGRTPAAIRKAARNGGLRGGPKAGTPAARARWAGLSPEERAEGMRLAQEASLRTKWCCDDCGMETTAPSLGNHQKYSGHTGRTRLATATPTA